MNNGNLTVRTPPPHFGCKFPEPMGIPIMEVGVVR